MSPAAGLRAWQGLMERDLRLFLRSRSQLYSSLLTPLLLLALLGTGVSRGLRPEEVREGDYTSFLVPGVIVMTALFSSTFASGSYYRDRDSGLLRVMLVSPHGPRFILFGKSLSGIVIGTLQALAILGVTSVLPGVNLAYQDGVGPSLGLAVGIIILLNLMLGGVAHLLASHIRTMQGFHLVMNLVLFPLLFLSGAFFPLAELPAWLEALARADPLTYAVEPLQLALYAEGNDGYLPLPIAVAVLGGLAVLFNLLAAREAPEA